MLQPMLATLADAPLVDPGLVYEPKYDGIRAILEADADGRVRLWSRLGNEKTNQFPEIVRAAETWAQRLPRPLVVDGEIVALDRAGQPVGFQHLQGRVHLQSGVNGPRRGARSRAGAARSSPSDEPTAVAFIAFDLLQEGTRDWRGRPLLERRTALERAARHGPSVPALAPLLRLSEMARGDGRALYKRALEDGWEGLIAKTADSRYSAGRRTPDWRKLKITQQQEFVVGGWTEPRQTRKGFGALLLGVYDNDALVYVGHTGTGFNQRELDRVAARLQSLEIKEAPFSVRPRTNERPHWARPVLVAQVKFTEWTADGKLRHPVYLGLRDDKTPGDVRREVANRSRPPVRSPGADPAQAPPMKSRTVRRHRIAEPPAETAPALPDLSPVLDQLEALEKAGRDGVIQLPDGRGLKVTNLRKVFWPKAKLTKGDLFRYYVRAAPFLLPVIADRPLVMKRFPNGVAAPPFYQHRASDAPAGVRIEEVPAGSKSEGTSSRRPHIIGGDLLTLLYTTQLAAISQDPWFSRLPHTASADQAAFDLDPMPGVPFSRVLDVARWIHEELQSLGATGVVKTSGADGLHVYVALPPSTPYEAGLLVCQIVATIVAQKHPKQATLERSVKARGLRVYIDCLQNIPGKTLAAAYSARASDFGGVSTPVTWDEIDGGVRREAFTIQSVPDRLRSIGDIWATLRTSPPIDLARVSRYAQRGV